MTLWLIPHNLWGTENQTLQYRNNDNNKKLSDWALTKYYHAKIKLDLAP